MSAVVTPAEPAGTPAGAFAISLISSRRVEPGGAVLAGNWQPLEGRGEAVRNQDATGARPTLQRQRPGLSRISAPESASQVPTARWSRNRSCRASLLGAHTDHGAWPLGNARGNTSRLSCLPAEPRDLGSEVVVAMPCGLCDEDQCMHLVFPQRPWSRARLDASRRARIEQAPEAVLAPLLGLDRCSAAYRIFI